MRFCIEKFDSGMLLDAGFRGKEHGKCEGKAEYVC